MRLVCILSIPPTVIPATNRTFNIHLTFKYRNLQHLTFYQHLINPHITPHIQPHIHPVIHAPIGGWALAAETVAVGGAAALQTPVVVLEETYDHAIIAPVIPPMTLVSDVMVFVERMC